MRDTLRRLAGIIRVNRGDLIRLAAVATVSAALPMLSIVLIHQFLASVLDGDGGAAAMLGVSVGPAAMLWLLAALLLATFLASAAANFFTAVRQERFVRTIELDLMERLVRHLLTLPVLTLERHTPGDLIEAVREDVQRLRSTVVALASGAVKCLTAAALVASAIWLSPRLAAIAFPILLAASVPLLLISHRVRAQGASLRRRAYRVFDLLLQLLRGIRVIKIYGGEQAEAGRAVGQIRHFFDGLIDIARARALSQVALETIGGLSVVVVIIVGGFEVLSGRLGWPALLAFLIAVRSLQGPLLQLNGYVLQMQRHVASIDRLDALLREPPSPRDGPDAVSLGGPIHHLVFDRVSFRYDDGVTALKDVSFELAQGEVLGVVGPSAAGKTTLLNLTARFFDPTSGVITVNGTDLRHIRVGDVQHQIAIVTQEPFLFSTSVRDNIRCGRPSASDAEVETAAQAAEIHDDILALPAGYDTLVGPGHRQLSGGQTQRINVARALLKNAPLLLLDEATSSLDSIAESRVQRAIARLMRGRTSIVVAHRLSTLRMATRILVLDRGSVASIGRHDELLVSAPLYQRMWQAQMAPEAEGDQRSGRSY